MLCDRQELGSRDVIPMTFHVLARPLFCSPNGNIIIPNVVPDRTFLEPIRNRHFTRVKCLFRD